MPTRTHLPAPARPTRKYPSIPPHRRPSIRGTVAQARRRTSRVEMARANMAGGHGPGGGHARMTAARIPANESADWANRLPRERRIAAKMFADTTTHLPDQSHRTTNHLAVLAHNRRQPQTNPGRVRPPPTGTTSTGRSRRVTSNLRVREPPPGPHRARRRDHHHAGEALRIAGSIVLGGLALLAGSRAWADSAEANAFFAEAKTAFEAEDFSKAYALFDRARAEGMQGPVIHYNIGAAAFRGGDLPRAERAFREVAEASNTTSMTALAHYNLGLVAMQTREEREARRWFERAIAESPDARVVELASRRIAELPEPRARPCLTTRVAASATTTTSRCARVRSRARQPASKTHTVSS